MSKKKSEPMLPEPNAKCAEATMGVSTYIACGKPAKNIVVGSDGVALAMCAMCTDHNIKNRGAHLAVKGEKVKLITADDIKASLKSQGEVLPVADVEDDESGPTDQQLKTISANVSRALKLQEFLIPEAVAALTKLQDELKTLNEVTLPNALTDAKMGGYIYKDRNDGKWEVELFEDVKASVTKAKLPKFIEYLTEIKEDGIVKRKIVIKFGRDQVKLAKKFIADLAKRKVDLQPTIDEEIHFQTLQAWVRERRQVAIDKQLDPDKAVPPEVDLFKLRVVRFSKKEQKGIDFMPGKK